MHRVNDKERFNSKINAVLKFFDYMYYGVRSFYEENKGSSPGITAIALMALMQSLNILIILFLYCLLVEVKLNISKLIFVGIYFFFLVLNGIRYSKLDTVIIKEKWEKENDKQKIRIRFSLVIYVVLSIALSFGLAIYLHSLET